MGRDLTTVVGGAKIVREEFLRRLQSMSIHRLREGPVTMQVSGAEVVEGKYGAQVRFDGSFLDDDNAALYVTERTAVAQLERIGLNTASCVGETLHFEHVHKDDRTYTNITRVTGDVSVPVPQVTSINAAPSVQAPAPGASKASSVDDVYESCLSSALRHCEELAEQGWNVETSDLVAMTATLFIQASRR